jgi:RimJ/RimL family protein N-acetyltransferase
VHDVSAPELDGLTLLPIDQGAAEALAAHPEAFAHDRQITFGPTWPAIIDIATQTARFLAATQPRWPWGSYLAVEGSARRLVGVCGFKGNPDADDAVEIAYFTFPGEEGRGVATRIAAAMVKLASEATPAPGVVRAHTLPETNASGRVLTKVGFRRIGEVIDPEDGLVWRWERAPSAAPGPSAP